MRRWRTILAAAGLTAAGLAAPAAAIDTVEPYQHTNAVNAPCAGSQCVVTFPAVPAGKRLVLTCVMAQLGSATGTIYLEGGPATGFVAKSGPAGGDLTQAVTFFYEAGSSPRARMYVPGTASISLIVTLVGHLVPK